MAKRANVRRLLESAARYGTPEDHRPAASVTFYSVGMDYNLKCYRLMSHDDGAWAFDLGAIDGEESYREAEIARRLKARNPNTTWVKK